MKVTETEIPGVLILEPKIFRDERGLFYETFHTERYAQLGIKEKFVQDNFSRSTQNVIRGLHYQKEHAQGKLVYVARGSVIDVIVDIRRGSKTFGKAITLELNDQNYRQIYIPPGLAHGFCVLSEHADFIYKCTDFYTPSAEYGLRWNDPDLQIVWPDIKNPILSLKDAVLPYLKDIPEDNLPN